MRISFADALLIVAALSAYVNDCAHRARAAGSSASGRRRRASSSGSRETEESGAGRRGVDRRRQAVYQKQCAGCHGDTGKGDGTMGEELTPKPSNLADADWKHGSTDGEIFTVIRDGVKPPAMRPYAARTDHAPALGRRQLRAEHRPEDRTH